MLPKLTDVYLKIRMYRIKSNIIKNLLDFFTRQSLLKPLLKQKN